MGGVRHDGGRLFLLLLFVHVASFAYFFLVLRSRKRTPAPVTVQYTAA